MHRHSTVDTSFSRANIFACSHYTTDLKLSIPHVDLTRLVYLTYTLYVFVTLSLGGSKSQGATYPLIGFGSGSFITNVHGRSYLRNVERRLKMHLLML